MGRAVARLGEVHDPNTGADTRAEDGRRPDERPVRPRRPRPSVTQPARRRPNPRDRHLTHENVPLADDLAGYPAISAVKWRSRGLPGDLADRAADPRAPHTTAR